MKLQHIRFFNNESAVLLNVTYGVAVNAHGARAPKKKENKTKEKMTSISHTVTVTHTAMLKLISHLGPFKKHQQV